MEVNQGGTSMDITCSDIAQFLEIIQGLVMRGLTFSADANALKITLTGGY
jgi:hypothetical protein